MTGRGPTLVYIYPVFGGHHDQCAARFVDSYRANPPGIHHETFVVCNGGPPSAFARLLFSPIACEFIQHDDSGWDIGAYQKFVEVVDSDMVMFCGGSTYFHKPNWLMRMAQVFNPNDLHGVFATYHMSAHIRTTGFCCSSALLRSYPHKVTRTEQRYGFEHGPQSLTAWCQKNGRRCRLVTWTGAYDSAQWKLPTNSYHRGNQSDCLMYDRLTDAYFSSSAERQFEFMRWSLGS